MSTPASPDSQSGSTVQADLEITYTLDVVARVCGLSSETLLEYHEQGLIGPVSGDQTGLCFDDDTIHRLRRIEHLRSSYDMNLAALKLTLSLLDEIEQLRAERRQRV